MLKPLEQFICDTCNEIIEDTTKGWVEWLSSYDNNHEITKEFRICHHKAICHIHAGKRHCHDSHLDFFFSEPGRIRLLSFLDIGPYHESEYSGPTPEDLRSFMDFFRRLTIPYYEEARKYWHDAIVDGYFGGENEISIYMSKNLKKMIEHFNAKQ